MSREDTTGDGRRERVAATLENVRAGVRQRQAQRAALEGGSRDLPPALARVFETRDLGEPVCVSHRPLVGPIVVFCKKAVFHLFMKWYLRSLLKQQNRFNHAASRALEELHERQEELERRLAARGEGGPPGGTAPSE